jgi:hypothetical protein
MLYMFLIAFTRAARPAQLTHLNLITLMRVGEEDELWSTSLRNFLK